MYRNWKRTAALCLTALLGCMMPVSTMLAAENGAETGADSTMDSDAFYSDEKISDAETVSDSGNVTDEEKGNVPDGESVAENETAADEESTSKDGSVPDGETVSEDEGAPDGEDVLNSENADEICGAGVMSVPAAEKDAGASSEDASENMTAPEIIITRGGQNIACSLGGEIAFDYVNNWGSLFEVSVGSNDQEVSLFYYLDKVSGTKAEAKDEEQMSSLTWKAETSFPISIEPLSDGNYVIYVKVKAGEQEYYARSSGIVVDTGKPVIKGVEEGKTYSEGTLFQVEDANLDYVLVNEQAVTPENGSYKVAANGTSCVIRAKDKAGNETVCSITVFGSGVPETSTVISKSGVYELKAGVKYSLSAGKWKVGGDKSVYQGGCDFYVTADGSYQFTL